VAGGEAARAAPDPPLAASPADPALASGLSGRRGLSRSIGSATLIRASAGEVVAHLRSVPGTGWLGFAGFCHGRFF